MSWRALVETAN